MNILKKAILNGGLLILLTGQSDKSFGQVFWLGLNGGTTYSWFNSPKVDNVVTGDGFGWNLGFFAKYGKRPFYKIGLHWTRAQTEISYDLGDGYIIQDNVPFHNFDLSLTAGYEIIHKPIFKWHINGGPFIGSTFLFSTNNFEFERDDMTNPQFGIITGTGIQFMNFIVDLDYQYHITDLFKGDEEDLGVDFGSHLQHISLKVGFQF